MKKTHVFIIVAALLCIAIAAGIYIFMNEESTEQGNILLLKENDQKTAENEVATEAELPQNEIENTGIIDEPVASTGRIDYIAHPELWTNTLMAPIGDPVPDEDYTEYVAKALLTLKDGKATLDEKRDALYDMELICDPMIMPAVLLALEDENADVRAEAIQAIRFMDHPCVVPAVEIALDDDDPEIRSEAIDALLNVKDISVNPALEKALWDENEDVRDEAATVLSMHESVDTLPVIEKMLDSDDPWLHEQAIDVLEDIPDTRAVDMLIEKGFTGSADTANAAREVLEQISGKTFILTENWQKWWNEVKATAPEKGSDAAWQKWLSTLRNSEEK